MDSNTFYRFITADGMAFALVDTMGYNCEENNGEAAPGKNYATICGDVFVDVNGPKKCLIHMAEIFFIFI